MAMASSRSAWLRCPMPTSRQSLITVTASAYRRSWLAGFASAVATRLHRAERRAATEQPTASTVDNDLWALPGDGMDLGESIADAAIREVAEETGLTVELTGLVGIYTDPDHVMAYDDGEVRQEFSVCFHARVTGAEAREDGSETKAVRWVDPDNVAALTVHPSMRRRIDDALAGRTTPQIV